MKNPVQPGKRRKRRVKPDGKRGNGRNIRSSGRKAAAAIGQPLRRRMVVNDEKMILTMYDIEIAASHGASADSVGPPVKFICLCVARVLFFFPVFLLFFYYYSFFFFFVLSSAPFRRHCSRCVVTARLGAPVRSNLRRSSSISCKSPFLCRVMISTRSGPLLSLSLSCSLFFSLVDLFPFVRPSVLGAVVVLALVRASLKKIIIIKNKMNEKKRERRVGPPPSDAPLIKSFFFLGPKAFFSGTG